MGVCHCLFFVTFDSKHNISIYLISTVLVKQDIMRDGHQLKTLAQKLYWNVITGKSVESRMEVAFLQNQIKCLNREKSLIKKLFLK